MSIMQPSVKNRNRLKIITIIISLLSILSFISKFEFGKADPFVPNIQLHYGGQYLSPYCIEKEEIVDHFIDSIENISVEKHWIDYNDPQNVSTFYRFKDSHQLDGVIVPFVLIGNSTEEFVLEGEEITQDNLNTLYYSIYNNTSPPSQENSTIDYWLSYLTGFIMGFSPCIVLVTTFMSSVMVIKEEQDKLLAECSQKQMDNIHGDSTIESNGSTTVVCVEPEEVSQSSRKLNTKKPLSLIYIGFIMGVIMMYVLLSVSTYSIKNVSFIANVFYGNILQLSITIILSLLGLWFIIDAFNKNSKLFQTSPKMKKYFSKLAKKGEFQYSFLLGFLFSFIKIPCVGSGLIALTMGLSTDFTRYIFSLILFVLGGITPLIVLMIIIANGMKIEKIDKFRVKFRPIIRLVSGALIIGVSLWSYLG